MSKKIQIEQLPATVTEEKILKLFSPFGVVLSVKFEGEDPNASLRSAIVDMANNEEAHKAIEKLNESKFEGQAILVHKAHGREHFEKKTGTNPLSKGFSGAGGGNSFRTSRGSNRGK